jgi:dTDP-4-amino-4,6-dideoxygalactose transaminase
MINSMFLPIVRGRFSHSISDDFSAIMRCLFNKVNEQKVLEYEDTMARHLSVNHCTSFSLARTAYWAILKALNLPAGSKVVLPSITIKAMLDVTLHMRLKPLFVDIDPITGCADVNSLEKLIIEKPKVMLLTYLFGSVPNVKNIIDITKRNSIFVIEDFSQCFNGQFNAKQIGTFGDVSILSTSAVKTLDTYGGGLVFTNNTKLFSKILEVKNALPRLSRKNLIIRVCSSTIKNVLTSRLMFTVIYLPILITAARKKNSFSRFVGNRSRSPIKTLPSTWFTKIHPIQAELGLKYLQRVKTFDTRRIAIANRYSQAVGFVGSQVIHGAQSVYWQCVLRTSNPALVRAKLALKGIDSAKTSLVLLSVLPEYGWNLEQSTPNSVQLHANGVYIPLYHQLTDREVKRISKEIFKLWQSRYLT